MNIVTKEELSEWLEENATKWFLEAIEEYITFFKDSIFLKTSTGDSLTAEFYETKGIIGGLETTKKIIQEKMRG